MIITGTALRRAPRRQQEPAVHRLPRLLFVAATTAAVSVVVLALSATSAFASGADSGRSDSKTTASSATGWDISWPQCPNDFPRGGAFGIVGVTNGRPWGANPCLGAEYKWATSRPLAPDLYMNTANPNGTSSFYCYCNPTPESCAAPYTGSGCAYDYGWYAAQNALTTATDTIGAAAGSATWWIDVETSNTWAGTPVANAADVQGSIDYLRSTGVPTVGIYSTPSQWKTITGSYTTSSEASYENAWGFSSPYLLNQSPDWVAGARNAQQAPAYCSDTFTGVAVRLSQFPFEGFDADYLCA